jgi:hypothetical protein
MRNDWIFGVALAIALAQPILVWCKYRLYKKHGYLRSTEE